MNIELIFGVTIIASLFVGLFAMMVYQSGLKVALGVWTTTFVIVALVAIGSYFITVGLK